MNLEKTFPEVTGSSWQHKMFEPREQICTLQVHGRPGNFQASIFCSEAPPAVPTPEQQCENISDGRKWAENEFRRLFSGHECNEFCWRGWRSFDAIFDAPEGPVN
jgi:hypothetical protein